MSISTIFLNTTNPERMNVVYVDHEKNQTTSNNSLSINTTRSALIYTTNNALDNSTGTKEVTIDFSSFHNPRIPKITGKIPYKEGVYNWNPPPRKPYENDNNRLIEEETGLILGICFVIKASENRVTNFQKLII